MSLTDGNENQGLTVERFAEIMGDTGEAQPLPAAPPTESTTDNYRKLDLDTLPIVADIAEPTVEVAPVQMPEMAIEATSTGYVAVDSDLANHGATVWYDAHGEAECGRLFASHIAMGFSFNLKHENFLSVPTPPSLKDALTRTANEWKERGQGVHRTKKGAYVLFLVKDLEKPAMVAGENPPEGSEVPQVVETPEDSTNVDFQEGCTLTLVGDQLTVTPPTHPRAEEFRARFQHHLTHYASADMAAWLNQIANSLKAVTLKSRGSIYYMPPVNVAKWRKVADLIQHATDYEFSYMPSMQTKDAIDAIFRAVKRNVTEIVEETEDSVTTASKGLRGMNVRGIRTRIETLNEALDKVRAYEKVLNVEMPDLIARVVGLRASLEKSATDTAQRGAKIELD